MGTVHRDFLITLYNKDTPSIVSYCHTKMFRFGIYSASEDGYVPSNQYEGLSKIFRTDAVKIISLTTKRL
jgi:hypothetical protein